LTVLQEVGRLDGRLQLSYEKRSLSAQVGRPHRAIDRPWLQEVLGAPGIWQRCGGPPESL